MGTPDKDVIIINPDFNQHFLPPSVYPFLKTPSQTQTTKGLPVPDGNVAEKLGTVGRNLAETIEREYNLQKNEWEQECRTAITALRNAVLMRQQRLDDINAEAARDAEIVGLLLGLVSAGGLRFFGAFVQYSYLPDKLRQTVTRLNLNQYGILTKFDETVEFSKEYAAALGGVVQDIGNRATSLGISLAKPQVPHNDNPSIFVNNVENSFFSRLSQDTSKVAGTLAGLAHWMTKDPGKPGSFGFEWAVECDNNRERGDRLITDHINMVRRRLADQWYFFGKSPVKANSVILQNVFERGLWASYVLENAPDRVWFQSSNGRFRAPIQRGRALPDKIVDRLKQLNVVIGETAQGRAEQRSRDLKGDATPTVLVEGKLDEVSEIAGLKKWARQYFGMVGREAEQYFPQGQPRKLQVL